MKYYNDVHLYKDLLAVMTELRGRFERSTSALRRLLRIFGLDLTDRDRNGFRGSKWLNIWSYFIFWLFFQAGFYMLLERSRHLDSFFLSLDQLVPILDRFSRFFAICLVHAILICKLNRTVELFCHKLEPIDFQLSRPDLSNIRFSSIAGVLWTLLVVLSN